jgi:hypothetical protein
MRHAARADAGEIAMNLRFRWFTYIPPGLHLSRKQRQQVHQFARISLKSTPSDLIGLAIGFIAAMVGNGLLLWGIRAMLAQDWLTDVDDVSGSVRRVTVLVMGGKLLSWTVALVIILAALRRCYRPHVLSGLRQSGFPVCPSCGYLQNGLGDLVTRCPECGTPREPIPEKSP